MHTEILTIDPNKPDIAAIERAAHLLRSGQLVAFPTETVYGLGANALDGDAVRLIFEAKGRPSNNPLIVHTATIDSAKSLAIDWPDTAQRLATQFWPGPLTLVLKKTSDVPHSVTAGGPTVAVRVPSHPVALVLIECAGVPVAAPSANRSNRLSPTLARHVAQNLHGRVPLILDGGATSGGLESTVVDVTREIPLVLRPGLLSVDRLREIIGNIHVDDSMTDAAMETVRSPGMLDRHYAPKTPMECWLTNGNKRASSLTDEGERVAWVYFRERAALRSPCVQIALPYDAQQYAARLYAVLHDLDTQSLDRIIVELPPDIDEWRAVRDRLRRASVVYDENM